MIWLDEWEWDEKAFTTSHKYDLFTIPVYVDVHLMYMSLGGLQIIKTM